MLSTAPRIKSGIVLKLERAGLIGKLLEAVKDERTGKAVYGQSYNGKIKVKRVGAYKSK